MVSSTAPRGVPPDRVRVVVDRPPRPGGEFVLYWMIAQRRLGWNFALDRAIAWAEELGKPLVVLEALRCDYRWASDRIHRFVIEGMAENARRAAGKRLLYLPYVEPAPGAGKGLLRALSQRACLIVTDDFPCFFLPRMVEAAARQVECRLEAVDGNGLFPLSATDAALPTAYAFRRILQKQLPAHLDSMPAAAPLDTLAVPVLERLLVKGSALRWDRASDETLAGSAAALAALPIDHSVAPGVLHGGSAAAEAHLSTFLYQKLLLYAENRNQPDEDGASGLSPYLHFGHISVHQILHELAQVERWSPEDVAPSTSGARSGWWRMSPPAEGFLDQVVTWREVGYHFCHHRADYDRFESLPPWALATLAKHGSDLRAPRYELEDLAAAGTYDPLWNAAQRQLAAEGRMHNYLRMLWGKKVLEWSATPQEALGTLIELNNKYALDGRNPNSYSGIFWCFGRFDRPWGPERPIFGTVRYMSSANTARKLHLKGYLARHGEQASLPGTR
ncbi:MAG: deoxyribodipyrimidine photo-lyase [Acidobacteriota bacterium]|nr:deoxyribodipyrimidine photo-lyase [Acidobacteriota bacterium]